MEIKNKKERLARLEIAMKHFENMDEEILVSLEEACKKEIEFLELKRIIFEKMIIFNPKKNKDSK